MGVSDGSARFPTRRQALVAGGTALLAGTLGFSAGCRVKRSATSTRGSKDKPNVIVYLADTLRADHLGCYGHSVPTTPHIDSFSESAFWFEKCFSQGSWTKPSIGSLFTGVLPRVHQAVATDLNWKDTCELPVQTLRSQFVTLAETLRSAGYHTGLFLANPQVQKEFGFAQGFDHYVYKSAHETGQQVSEVIAWIATDRQSPFFAFVHELDPHGPYTPPPIEYTKLYGVSMEEDRNSLSIEDTRLLDAHESFYLPANDSAPNCDPVPLWELSPGGLAFLKRLYDAEIAHVDRHLGRLLSYLDRKGLAHNTVVVLTADHGEAFNEHGKFGHGNSIFNEEIHVPLIVRIPGQQRGGRVPYSVALYDLYPTLTTLTGASTPSYVQAKTLVDSAGACVVDKHRAVFSELDHYRPDTDRWDACVQQGSYKVRTHHGGQGMTGHILTQDRAEAVDLLEGNDVHGSHLRDLSETLRTTIKATGTLAASFGEAEWTNADEHHREELNAIGYL
ncbi:MAG: sulfatase-like hydrolase/transferase [Nitrospiraceae bacterium]|nr:sulfatase-like hydrolase/transferase [Nitrospiraceae bacterium]